MEKCQMKIKIITILIIILGVLFIGASSRNRTLYYAAPHFPPWDINTEGNEVKGINADIIRSIAKELGLTFEPIQCPWKRCLSLLEHGKIDMAGTVGRKPERERYLHFIEPTYAKVPDQVFYLPINSEFEIRAYEDLYQSKGIGIERGARVSPRFDEDTKLRKEDKAELIQIIKMLNSGRLEVVAGNEMVMDYMIKKKGMQGKFRKAKFRFVSDGMEYLAISKKSPHAERLAEISRIVHKMKESGKIQEYIQNYTGIP